MQLFFLRHAHSLSQVDRSIVVGRAADKRLSEQGLTQARSAADVLKSYGFKRIHSSTCIRALQTAGAVSNVTGVGVEPSALLVERSHGDLEGLKKEDVYTPELIEEIHKDQLRWRPPNGETLEDVIHRLREFLVSIYDPDETAPQLVVTHLMVLWGLFYGCTQCNHAILPGLFVDNAGLVQVDMRPSGEVLLSRWNQAIINPA